MRTNQVRVVTSFKTFFAARLYYLMITLFITLLCVVQKVFLLLYYLVVVGVTFIQLPHQKPSLVTYHNKGPFKTTASIKIFKYAVLFIYVYYCMIQ